MDVIRYQESVYDFNTKIDKAVVNTDREPLLDLERKIILSDMGGYHNPKYDLLQRLEAELCKTDEIDPLVNIRFTPPPKKRITIPCLSRDNHDILSTCSICKIYDKDLKSINSYTFHRSCLSSYVRVFGNDLEFKNLK